MAATVDSTPASPVSAYRPMNITVSRTDPSGSQITFIRPATSSDVSTYGAGLEEGDILVNHAPLQGSVSGVVGQTLNFYEGCEDYAGVHTITKVISSQLKVIDAPNYGAFTPGSGTAFVRVWLNNYAIHCRVKVYTDPAGTPKNVDLGPMAVDDNGEVTFDVGHAIRRHFITDISGYCGDVPGTEVIQNAHGLTALFYKWVVAETYDVPGETDVPDAFDGTHDVDEETDFQVAVNAIHPYHQQHEVGGSSAVTLSWADTDLSDYVVVDGGRFLTYASRTQYLTSADRFRLFILTREASSYRFASDWYLRVRAINTDGTTGSEILSKQIALGAVDTAAVSIAVGPADLSPFMTLPASNRYRVYISNFNEDILSETFDFRITAPCEEVRRPFRALNKLGGIDFYTFQGRETQRVRVSRSTKRKPMGSGSSFDYARRVYRAEPERSRQISTLHLTQAQRQWISETFMESPSVVCEISTALLTPVDILTTEADTYTTQGGSARVVLEYAIGVDNQSQQA